MDENCWTGLGAIHQLSDSSVLFIGMRGLPTPPSIEIAEELAEYHMAYN